MTSKPTLAIVNIAYAMQFPVVPPPKPALETDAKIGIGVGVIDIKVNHIETPDEVAAALERVERVLGPGRVQYVHPDCGFWMLKRSVADRKIAALVKGRDLYLGSRG